MSAPPFTLQAFIALAERENRRGRDISAMDPAVRRATRALQKRRDAFRRQISVYKRDDPARTKIIKEYRDDRQGLRQIRDAAVESALHQALVSFEQKLDLGTFTFGLKSGPVVKKKETFCIDPALEVLFPAKQAAESIKCAASIQTPSRNSIVRALKATFDKKFEHAIYRMDIENFFESISHPILLKHLSQHSKLDSVSIQLVQQILAEFEAIKGEKTGIPRGVGLSSQLAEIYLNEFDLKVKTHPSVIFYARYVDDVVVVVENNRSIEDIQQVIANEIKTLGLSLNHDKTHAVKTDKKGNYLEAREIEYLGYRFHRNEAVLTTGLTEKRADRRAKRLELAIELWLSKNPNLAGPNHGHDGQLDDRIRYLAGNTRLLNTKSNVAIGLFHSNSALDEGSAEFEQLDVVLSSFLQAHHSKMTDDMQKRLKQICFVKMFKSKPFLRFQQKRLEQITSIWKVAGI